MSTENKLGQEPAYANTETYNPNNMECNDTFQQGMSKRFYAACAALQGILANPNTAGQVKYEFGQVKAERANEIVVRTAYSLADELLKQEQL